MMHWTTFSILSMLLLGNVVSADVIALNVKRNPPTAVQLTRRGLDKRATVKEILGIYSSPHPTCLFQTTTD